MIAVPVLRWVWGEGAEKRGIEAGVLLQAGLSFAIVAHGVNLLAASIALLLVALLGWSVEFCGHRSGFPFGRYHYTPRLRPQLGGVPLLIPLAWFMMMPAAWSVALLFHQTIGLEPGWLSFSLVAGVVFTAWDLYLDPQMVAWDFWRWKKKGRYFGIPLSNYAGWFGASAVISLLFWILPGGIAQLSEDPVSLPLSALAAVYAFTWILEFVGQMFFWKLRGPALIGALGMGVFVVASFLPFLTR